MVASFLIRAGAFTQSSLLDGSESDGTNLISTALYSRINTVGGADFDVLAPDGTNSATFLKEDGASGRHIGYREITATINAFRLSVYAQLAVGTRYLVLYMAGGNSSGASLYVNLSTGTITDSEVTGTGTITSSSVQAAENSYWKIQLEGTLGSSHGGPHYPIVALSDVSTYGSPLESDNPSYAGDNASGFNLWRFKLVAL